MNVVHEQVWQDFLKIIREEVGSRAVETWIKAVTFSHYDPLKSELYVLTPNVFVKNWVEVHYKELFSKHLARLFGVSELQVIFSVHSSASAMQPSLHHESTKIVPAVSDSIKKKKNELVKKTVAPVQTNAKLNGLYTFDTFVVGENNQFAYASARAVADKLGTLYNPLLFYGGSGLGKTHLLHAMGNYVLAKNSNLSVLYQTADRFISEFIQAIRFDCVVKFQAKYKDIDLFLIDDIQFMINKEQTQEVFFHIFNSLYESNKQIVLSCDVLPRYLGGLADRLKSRLEWGLIADLAMPSVTTKIEIVKYKAKLQNFELNDDVACFVAQHNVASVRELEGFIIRVLAYASLTGQAITIELVRKVLGSEYETPSVVSSVDLNAIMAVIKKHFGYDLATMRSKDRSKDVSHARQIAMYLIKQYTNKSLREIGEYLHRKDHTTITHALTRINELKQHDEKLLIFLKNLHEELR
jgi:chromosomal replication initiator protein